MTTIARQHRYEAVKQSIRDAISDDPQPDWKDSLSDALDVIEAVEAERDDLLLVLKRALEDIITLQDLVGEDHGTSGINIEIRNAIAKAGGAK